MERLEWNQTYLIDVANVILEHESNERAAIALDSGNQLKQAQFELRQNPSNESLKINVILLQDRHSSVMMRCQKEMDAIQRAAQEEILSLSK